MSMAWQGPTYRHYFDVSYTKAIPSVPGGAAVGLDWATAMTTPSFPILIYVIKK